MERNVTLDCFKILLSIFVIVIHLEAIFDKSNVILWIFSTGLVQVAVPCFFIINGYYFFLKIDTPKAVGKYLIHLFIIYTTWFVIYLRPFLYRLDKFYILEEFRFDLLFKLYFSESFFHLWYVIALIYGICILFVLKKFLKKDVIILVAAIILFTAGYYLSFEKGYLSNSILYGLFLGFPFVALGYLIRSKDIIKKIKGKYIYGLLLISSLAIFVGAYLNHEILFVRKIYYSLFIFCPAIFIFILNHSKYVKNSKLIAYLGALPSAIYFVHVYIIFLSFSYFPEVGVFMRFLIVLFFSVIASFAIIFINKYLKIFL